jgi:DNA repair exonuclease SbcCD nuclease subunit
MAVKKIIHCADIHIRTFRMHEEYKEIFQLFIDRCKELAEGYEHNEVRIAVVGDLVHQKITISNEQLMLSCWFLDELSQIAPVVVVAGNHDLLENNKDRMDSISPMIQLLKNKHIAYLKESKCYPDANILWANYSIFEGNERPDIEAGKAEHGNDKTVIGLFHAPLAGAITDIGYEFDEHHGALSQFQGCDMVLLGDIHKRQSFTYDGIPIAYPSSLIQQGFGETVSKHGFLWWDVETRTFEEEDIETRYGFYQFKIESVTDIENNKEQFTNP